MVSTAIATSTEEIAARGVALEGARRGTSRLRVAELRASYGERRVLDGVSFEVGPGEIVGLLGPNGCGKSTALSVLVGLVRADSVRVSLEGVEVAPGGRAMRTMMGVVFQSPSLDPRLRVRENLRFAAALYGLAGKEREDRIDAALVRADLVARAGDLVKELSGGMRRRLELERALLHRPELLLLDEPTTGLDEVSFRRAWHHLSALRDDGMSVLLSTHRAEEAAACDRVLFLHEGRVVADGSPEALIAEMEGDVITLEVEDPVRVAELLRERLGLEARVVGGRVRLEGVPGPASMPRLVEALPDGVVRSMSLHRPTLADVFARRTGSELSPMAGPRSDRGASHG